MSVVPIFYCAGCDLPIPAVGSWETERCACGETLVRLLPKSGYAPKEKRRRAE